MPKPPDNPAVDAGNVLDEERVKEHHSDKEEEETQKLEESPNPFKAMILKMVFILYFFYGP